MLTLVAENICRISIFREHNIFAIGDGLAKFAKNLCTRKNCDLQYVANSSNTRGKGATSCTLVQSEPPARTVYPQPVQGPSCEIRHVLFNMFNPDTYLDFTSQNIGTLSLSFDLPVSQTLTIAHIFNMFKAWKTCQMSNTCIYTTQNQLSPDNHNISFDKDIKIVNHVNT